MTKKDENKPVQLERVEFEKYRMLSTQLQELEATQIRTNIWLEMIRPELKALEAKIQEKYKLDPKKKWYVSDGGIVSQLE